MSRCNRRPYQINQNELLLYIFWHYSDQMISLLNPERSESRHFIERQDIIRIMKGLGLPVQEIKGTRQHFTLHKLNTSRLRSSLMNLMKLKKSTIPEIMTTSRWYSTLWVSIFDNAMEMQPFVVKRSLALEILSLIFSQFQPFFSFLGLMFHPIDSSI